LRSSRPSSLALSRDGLGKRGGRATGRTEQEIYRRLGLSFIPPELREGQDEVQLARARKLPLLIEQRDLKGLLYVHTDFSDGVRSLREMAEAAHERGYRYLGVSDHSQSAHYAGGLSINEILQQQGLIDALNEEFDMSFRILKGIESDIRADGSLDYPDDILARFDFIVASVQRRDKAEQTARIVKAVSDPFTTIPGHSTGRLCCVGRAMTSRSSRPCAGILLPSRSTAIPTASSWTGVGTDARSNSVAS
jgi:DNA polymerase (family X)